MEKKYKETEFDLKVHEVFNQIILTIPILKKENKSLAMADMGYWIPKWIEDTDFDLNTILNVLLGHQLIMIDGFNYILAPKAYSIMDYPHRYLDYLKELHSVKWQEEEDKKIARNLNATAKSTNIIISIFTGLTFVVFIIQTVIIYLQYRKESAQPVQKNMPRIERLQSIKTDSIKKTDNSQNLTIDKPFQKK